MTPEQLDKIVEFFESIGLGNCIDVSEDYINEIDQWKTSVININFNIVDNCLPVDKIYSKHSITLRAGDNQFYCICDIQNKETAMIGLESNKVKNIIDAECFLY